LEERGPSPSSGNTALEVRIKPDMSNGKSVKLTHPMGNQLSWHFARRIACWWGVCETREIWLHRGWNWRGK